jgi:50S ribosomal protein L16 3-hydroxylase
MIILEKWDEELFFNNFWNKHPCIIQNFISKDSCQDYDANELSSLALEEDIVSRIIQFKQDYPKETKLRQGPFTESDLQSLPIDSPWSLLIQDAEKKTDLFDPVVACFSTIPSEFFDDVMISIGNKDSGTGPHLDWYNVFIIQTHGEKNWKVEKNKRSFKDHDNSIVDDLEIKILNNFNDFTEHDLSPGEMLYIPPGHGHHGVSKAELSMSLSIGFQGPRLITLIETYLSKILGNIHEDQRIDFCPSTAGNLNLESWPKEIPLENNELLTQLIKLAKEQDY